jgi:hypothetical protein
VQERELAVGRDEEQPVRFRDGAGDLGEELRARDPDGDRQADLLADSRLQSRRDLERRPGDALHAVDVEERLVDRQPFDERRRILEDTVERLARLRVRAHARPHHDRVRAEPASLAAAHRRAHAVRLRLVARGEHHPAADDHRLAA